MPRLIGRRPDPGAPRHRPAVPRRLHALLQPDAVRRLATAAFVLIVAIFAGVRLFDVWPWNAPLFDLWAYWSTRFGLDYGTAQPGETGAYIYSPAFAMLIAPLAALPLPMFTAAWTALLAAALYWLTGWRAFFVGALAPVAMSIAIGQVDLLMAAVIVLGFRWPAAWALPIITKVTPGLGLLWYAARGEWRSLAMAGGATAALVGLSMLVDPRAWLGWIDMLLRSPVPTAADGVFLPVPMWVRLPLVALAIVWAARTNRRWVLPVAITFSLPTVWVNTPTILVAVLPLIAFGADAPAAGWLRARSLGTPGDLLRLRRRVRRAGLLVRRELAR